MKPIDEVRRSAKFVFNINIAINLFFGLYALLVTHITWAVVLHTLLLVYVILSRIDILLMDEFVEHAGTLKGNEFMTFHQAYHDKVFNRRFGALRLWLERHWKGEL